MTFVSSSIVITEQKRYEDSICVVTFCCGRLPLPLPLHSNLPHSTHSAWLLSSTPLITPMYILMKVSMGIIKISCTSPWGAFVIDGFYDGQFQSSLAFLSFHEAQEARELLKQFMFCFMALHKIGFVYSDNFLKSVRSCCCKEHSDQELDMVFELCCHKVNCSEIIRLFCCSFIQNKCIPF